jgi:hypothetical protein
VSKESKVYALVWFWLGVLLSIGEPLFVGFIVWTIGASAGWLFGPTIRTLRYAAASALTLLTFFAVGVVVVDLQAPEERSGTLVYEVQYKGHIYTIEAPTPKDAYAVLAERLGEGGLAESGPDGKLYRPRIEPVGPPIATGATKDLYQGRLGIVAVLGFIAAMLWNPVFFWRLFKEWFAAGHC